MDYDLDSEHKRMAKGPFYGAASFIFVLIAIYVSFSLHEQETLGHWQIASCFIGTGLITILLFLPHFLEGIVDRIEEILSNNDSDSLRMAIFEVKEIRSGLDALALKIDKIPTLVDKIVTESLPKNEEGISVTSIAEKLKDLETNINAKVDQIEQNILSNPLLPALDPSEDTIKKSLEQLNEQLAFLQKNFAFPKETPILPETTDSRTQDDEDSTSKLKKAKVLEQVSSTLANEELSFDTEVEKEEKPTDSLATDLADSNIDSMDGSEEQEEELQDLNVEDELEETTISSQEDRSSLVADDSGTPTAELSSEPETIPVTKKELPQELDLGLPTPEETLRKVDALLGGKQSSEPPEKPQENQILEKNNGTTTVVANVMIGIGNKPFLRGEGPGLSWDEGVSMNFVEIGKWAWSPPRKNASLIVQVYRNDQDPDKGGKVEVKPGQKLEITPEFP